MTKGIMNWFLESLRQVESLTQVEPYEGQFEDPEDITVFPPAAFVILQKMENNKEELNPELVILVSVYLVTTHVAGTSPNGMLDLIDSVVELLHFKGVHSLNDDETDSLYFGRCILTKSAFYGILPGMSVSKLDFTIRKNHVH